MFWCRLASDISHPPQEEAQYMAIFGLSGISFS
jgi:hypothetical protein